jgi:hypothetical protein
MIQFNLLPDVKVEFVKAQRTKRLVIGSALIASGASFVIFLLLLVAVHGVQKKSMSDLNGDINQLESLNDLHNDKVVASRIFSMMQQTTPSDVTISDHTVDFTANSMTITGAAPSLDRVNTFADTLKFTTLVHADNSSGKAFSDVVLSQFGRDEKGSTYTITLSYDPLLFSNKETGEVIIPKTVTTRSVIGQPTDIFKKTTAPGTVTGQ